MSNPLHEVATWWDHHFKFLLWSWIDLSKVARTSSSVSILLQDNAKPCISQISWQKLIQLIITLPIHWTCLLSTWWVLDVPVDLHQCRTDKNALWLFVISCDLSLYWDSIIYWVFVFNIVLILIMLSSSQVMTFVIQNGHLFDQRNIFKHFLHQKFIYWQGQSQFKSSFSTIFLV